MKKLLCAVMLWCVSASATTTISGTLRDLGTNTVSSRSFVRLWLRGCGANPARVNGTGLLLPKYIDFTPDASGNISGTVYSTRNAAGTGDGDIECGGSKQSVWYGLQAFRDGKPDAEIPVHANNTGTLNITSATPITTTPVVTAPTGDTTYQRLDGGNNAAGSYVPGGDNLYDLGASATGWRTGYFSTSLMPKTDNVSDLGASVTAWHWAYLRGLTVAPSSAASPTQVSLAGQPSSGSNNGGNVSVTAGNGGSTPSAGGVLTMSAGTGAGAGAGGAASLSAGGGGVTNANGGAASVFGGAGTGSGNGGDVVLSPGAGGGSGLSGGVKVQGRSAPAVSGGGSGEYYFDSTANRFLASENGGAYRYFAGTLLNQQGALSAVVGTGADATVYSYTVPANTMLAGKGIRVKVLWHHSTGTAAVTYKLKLGSTTLHTPVTASTTNSDGVVYEIFNNSGVQNAQNGSLMATVAAAPSAGVFTAAENTANALALTFTMSVAASDQVTPKFWLVEQIN